MRRQERKQAARKLMLLYRFENYEPGTGSDFLITPIGQWPLAPIETKNQTTKRHISL
jgi:hypothetical protein